MDYSAHHDTPRSTARFTEEPTEGKMDKHQLARGAASVPRPSQSMISERPKSLKNQSATNLLYNFHKVLSSSLPFLPPCLQANILTKSSANVHRKEVDRVQVLVQLASCPDSGSTIALDKSSNTITFTDPNPSMKATGSSAPKSYAVDTVMDADCPLVEVCSNTLKNVIRTVVRGEDGCVLSFGNVPPGDCNPMIGSDGSSSRLGIMPCAILWLFNYINTVRRHDNSRFSIRISATEVSKDEGLCRDLLSTISSTCICDDAGGAFSAMSSPVELRAVDFKMAAYYLDYALSERSMSGASETYYLVVTLHLYQYHMQNDSGSKVSGGRSRLHLIDLGSRRSRDNPEGNATEIQRFFKVILALWNGQSHILYPECSLTQLLRRIFTASVGSIQTSMIFSISGKEDLYDEALQSVQFASKVYRQKNRLSTLSSSTFSDENSSTDSFTMRRMNKTRQRETISYRMSLSSDMDATSSSEVSVDTVIYRGKRPEVAVSGGRGLADGSSKVQLNDPPEESQALERSPERKLSTLQPKRKSNTRTGYNVWQKVSVKKALKAVKSDQELWVDGPNAFRTLDANNEDPDEKETISNKVNASLGTGSRHLCMAEKANPEIVSWKSKMHSKYPNKAQLTEIPLNKNDYKTSNVGESGSVGIVKSSIIANWLSKQADPLEDVDIDILYANISRRKDGGTKIENDKLYDTGKGDQTKLTHKSRSDQTTLPKSHCDVLERRIPPKDLSRVEEWINSVRALPSKRVPSPEDCKMEITQFSLYSSTFSPYHVSQCCPAAYCPIPSSPQIDIKNHPSKGYDHGTSTAPMSTPRTSTSLALDNESSRMRTFSTSEKEKSSKVFADPFEDGNQVRCTNLLAKIPESTNLPEVTQRPSHKNEASNKTSPINGSKKHRKDFKKKETKKGFSFFNQLIKNKKIKKEIPSHRSHKEDTLSKDSVSYQTKNQNDPHTSDMVDYSHRVAPPLLLSSPYHMVGSLTTSKARGDSSGHGSDCSSFNGVKTNLGSATFHPESSTLRLATSHRAASSGYESIFRDSEISSHNDSASEYSVSTNVAAQSPTDPRDLPRSKVLDPPAPGTPKIASSKTLPTYNQTEESEKVRDLIAKEKTSILLEERAEMVADLLAVMTLYNQDSKVTLKDLERSVKDMIADDQSTESLRSNNPMLQSVLSRYQSNVCMITSFLSTAGSGSSTNDSP